MVTFASLDRHAVLATPPDDLCLEFANTLFWRGSKPPTETLHGPDDLLAWARASAGAPQAVADACRATWAARPGDAADAFRAAIDVRETIQRMFAAVASRQAPAAADLSAFNRWLGAAPVRSQLGQIDDGFGWDVHADAQWNAASDTVAPLLLAGVLWSGADLLTGPRRARVRRCANDRCLWLFLDDSKSGNRRWCSMSACGNRAKARRHYLKHRHSG